MQGHAVTLTFKEATQLVRVTRGLNMVIISVKLFQNLTSNKKVMGRTRFCCKVMLWPWPSRLWPKCCARHIVSIWWSFLWNSFKIRLQITKLWAGHDFAARSCCDLDLQGSDPNVARDTSSQYGDHFCEIFSKADFKKQCYGSDTTLLQGHAVTLTFKVATQMLRATRRFNMVIISVKYFRNPTSNNNVMGRTQICCKVALWPWLSR